MKLDVLPSFVAVFRIGFGVDSVENMVLDRGTARTRPGSSACSSVRVWHLMSRGRGHGLGDRRRRAFMLPILQTLSRIIPF